MKSFVLFSFVCTVFSSPPPAPTILIAPEVQLPMVVLGTGSGQKGNVSQVTQLWLGKTSGVGIDTALIYFDESKIAEGISLSKKPRDQIFLETKIPCSTYKKARENIESNLQQLNMTHADLMLIHSNECLLDATLNETWRALEDALAAGQTRAIGVSHFTVGDFENLNFTVKPALNQCELSVSYHDDSTIEYFQTHGVVYQAFSPLCGGFKGSSCSAHGGKNVMTVPEVIEIAKTHSVSPAKIALKWIVQQGFPLATATAKLDYMNEDLDLWSWGNLSETEMKKLSNVYPGNSNKYI